MTVQPFKLCKKCNNQLSKDGSCPYCTWKGDEGPGALLRDIIKKENAKHAVHTDYKCSDQDPASSTMG